MRSIAPQNSPVLTTLLQGIRSAWEAGRPPQSCEGRVIYSMSRPAYLGPAHPHRVPPPSREDGQAVLRTVLLAWRTDYAELAEYDAAHGGGIRHALVAAGLLLSDGTDDARERADDLVLRATCGWTKPSYLKGLIAFSARLKAMPEPAPWCVERVQL